MFYGGRKMETKLNNYNQSKNKKYPCEDAFLTNPVASANDRTGYVRQVPLNVSEAESLSQMFEDIPVTVSRKVRRATREYYGKPSNQDKKYDKDLLP